jgi:hypothetical protein
MKRFVATLLVCLFASCSVLAQVQEPEATSTDARRNELSRELGAIVEQAVNEGLLEPVGKAKPERAPKVIVPKVTEPKPPAAPADASTSKLPAAAELPQAPAPVMDCSAPYPLDFSEFGKISEYAHIYAYRETKPVAGEAASTAAHPAARLAKAYLALDLAPEAAITLRSARDQEAVAVQQLSALLQDEQAPPVEYFTQLAACYPQAKLWQSVALIKAQDVSGGPMLEAELKSFRKLPLQLRDRVALITIPGLDALDQSLLAKLLIASFSEEEVNNSSQLQFSKAVLGLAAGDPDADRIMRTFLVQARFQKDALSALLRHGRPVTSPLRDVLLDDMVNRIEVAGPESDIARDLRFVLGEMSASSMYGPMMKIAELPGLKSPAARAELGLQLSSAIKRDLESDDPLKTLAAIEAMVNDPGYLDSAPGRDELFDDATVAAGQLGLGTLSERLASKAKGGEGIAEQRAVLASRQSDRAELADLVIQYPDNQRIGLIAARAAIDADDRAKLARIEPKLNLEPEIILALIEQDASSGNWIVSDRVYSAASKLTEDTQKMRVARVLKLKSQPELLDAGSRVPMSSVSATLSRSRESLAKLSGDAP